MSTRRVDDGIVLDCDVTGCLDSLQGEETTALFDTEQQAIAAGNNAGWTSLGHGDHACNRGNRAHHEERTAAPEDDTPNPPYDLPEGDWR